MKETYDNNFYEDAEDSLQVFRKKYRGALIGKGDSDPFAKDPDSIQGEHEQTLAEKQGNMLLW